MPTIQLYDYEAAACPTKVRWALAEEGLPWERLRVDLAEYEHKSDAYLAVHPDGVVPAARVDGQLVREASAIMKHIARATGSNRILPSDAASHDRIDRALEVAAAAHPHYGLLLYSEVFLPLQKRRSPEERARALGNVADPVLRERLETLIDAGVDRERIARALVEVESAFGWADRALATSQWLAGARFTIADIDLFPYIHTPIRLVSDLWSASMPNLARWLGHMRERSAFAEAVLNFPYDTEVWSAIRDAPHGGGFPAIPEAA